MFDIFKNKDIVKRLQDRITEAEESIKAYSKYNLFNEVAEETRKLNELKYILTGDREFLKETK